ncbi:MAG: glycosyltransferase family 2 protein [Caulobacterales bacterium]
MAAASVLTTVYNGAGFVARYCETVRAASHLDMDWLLVDDGSTDSTVDDTLVSLHAAGLADRVQILRPGRLGRPGALNFGVTQVRTPVFFIHDFDDESWPVRYPAQLELLASDGRLACVGGGYVHVWPALAREETRSLNFDPARYRRHFPLYVPFPHTLMAFRTEAVRQVGGYPDWDDYEEMGLIGRLLAAGWRLGAVNAVVGRHFVYPQSYFESRRSFAGRRLRNFRRQLSMRRELPFIAVSRVEIAARFAYSFLPTPIKRLMRERVGHAN